MTKSAQINIIGVTLTTPQKIIGLTNLGVNHVRVHINATEWAGSSSQIEAYIAAGFTILLVLQHNPNTPTAPYCDDIPLYISVLNQLLTLYGASIHSVAIGNEEDNDNYYTNPETNFPAYIAQLTAAIPVVHSYGKPIINGGITPRPLAMYVYRYYFNKGWVDKSNLFASRCLPDSLLAGLQTPGTNAYVDGKVALVSSLLATYKNLALDYVNWHCYEPAKLRSQANAYALTTGIDVTTKNYICQCSSVIKKVTGKQAVSNELGILNDSGLLVTSMLNAFNKANYPFISWYAGGGIPDEVVQIVNDDMTLRPAGTAFLNHI